MCVCEGIKMKTKDYKNSKIIKVNCDFCGKDMECPEEMLKTSKRYMCYTCFQNPKNIKNVRDEELKNIHVDVPMDELTDTIAKSFQKRCSVQVHTWAYKHLWIQHVIWRKTKMIIRQ
jgi:hypothetical protein